MKKILLSLLILMCFVLAGCSDSKVETNLFNYDVTLRVPKGASVGNDLKVLEGSSPYYDEYNIKATSEDNVIIVNVDGDYFDLFEVSINPDIQSLDCRSMATLKLGEEKKIIDSAATYVMGLYYAAQNGEKDIPLGNYVSSIMSDESKEKIEGYYNDICSLFATFDPNGSIISYGIYDLMFTDFLGNVTKNEEGGYRVNITLSYSYINKASDVEDENIFNDFTLSVDMSFENGKWVVADIENPLIF